MSINKRKICGIYKIENITNSKKYIGQSKNIEQRFKQHGTLLKNMKHNNIHLQNSYNKYGEENFTYEMVEECNVNELDDREIYWINYYHSDDGKYGYNKDQGGSKHLSTEKFNKMQKGQFCKRENISTLCIDCVKNCKQIFGAEILNCYGFEENLDPFYDYHIYKNMYR